MLGAFKFGDVEVIRTLLELGAPVDFADGNQITMLSRSVLNHELELAKMLIARGANVNATDKLGMTPLLWAASSDFGDTAMVELLLKSGAKADAKNRDGRTALELARAYKHDYLVPVLGAGCRDQLDERNRKRRSNAIFRLRSPGAADLRPRRVTGAFSLAGQGVPRLDSYNGVVVRILQSNNAGNISHHIIDPATNRVTGSIRGCPNPHNLTTHRDGLYYYCSNESEDTVDVFDTKTLQLVTQIPLSGNPNKIVVNKKHKKIYAGIRAWTADKRAVVDVIDIATHKRVRSVAVHHPVHNTDVTPDDNFVIAGLAGEVKPGEPTIQVIDPVTDQVVWGMELTGHQQYGRNNHEVRPMAFEANRGGIDQADVRPGHRHQCRVGDRLEQAPGRGHALAAEAPAVEAERRRYSDRRHARPRGAAGSIGGVGVEPPRQPDLRLDTARSEVHRRRGSRADGQLDDADAGQQVHVRRDIRVRPHDRGGPEEAGDRREDQDRRAAGADQHGDPAAEPRQRRTGLRFNAALHGVRP